METAAIAHVCFANGVPFIAIRSITDTPEKSGINQFEKNCEKAAAIAKNLTLSLIEELTEN